MSVLSRRLFAGLAASGITTARSLAKGLAEVGVNSPHMLEPAVPPPPTQQPIPDAIQSLDDYLDYKQHHSFVPRATLGIRSYSDSYRMHKEAEAYANRRKHPGRVFLREFFSRLEGKF